jgi:recombinational DNA repair protein RecR
MSHYHDEPIERALENMVQCPMCNCTVTIGDCMICEHFVSYKSRDSILCLYGTNGANDD